MATTPSANILRAAADRAGARVVVVQLPFPGSSAEAAIDLVVGAVTPRTRLAVIDHVTSTTALVLPVAEIVRALSERGVDTLVDGAHAPGTLDLDVTSIGAAYYTGNAHKWLCSPKGAGFLQVRRDLHRRVRPLAISHGANSPRTDRPRFRLEHDWTGTADPSAYLSIPAAIEFGASLLDGGWPALRDRNREVALRGRDLLCSTLGIDAPAPDTMLGSMATVALPLEPRPAPARRWHHRRRPSRGTRGAGHPGHGRAMAAASRRRAVAARHPGQRRRPTWHSTTSSAWPAPSPVHWLDCAA